MKEIKDKLKKIGMIKIQIFSIIISVIIVALGGVKMLALTIVFVFGLLIGRFYEKTVSAIKDYRLMQKVNKIEFEKVEFENMRKENENLKKHNETLSEKMSEMVSRGPRVAPMPPTPPAYHSQGENQYNYYGSDY